MLRSLLKALFYRHKADAEREPIQYAMDCIYPNKDMYCYKKHRMCYHCDCMTCKDFIRRTEW